MPMPHKFLPWDAYWTLIFMDTGGHDGMCVVVCAARYAMATLAYDILIILLTMGASQDFYADRRVV